MKKLNFMFFAALAAVCSFSSCSDDEPEATVGITAVRVATAEGTVRNGVIDQNANTVTVTMPVTTLASELESCTVTATATMGTTVTINGAALEGNTFNLSSPVTLTATGNGSTKSYTLKVSCTEEETDLTSGKLISADITGGGLPNNTYNYSVALYKGKFYAFTASATEGVGAYRVYTSSNGKLWTEMPTTEVVGGMGAAPVVYNDKLYVLGGLRAIGTDQLGNAPDVEGEGWGMSVTLDKFRRFATTGSSWSDESIQGSFDDPEDRFKVSVATGGFGFIGVYPYIFNGKLYMQSGYAFSFGMLQGSHTNLYVANGDSFVPVAAAAGSLRTENTSFVLNNKVFNLGGNVNYFGPTALVANVYSSEDGENFVEEGEASVGPICGATVVTNKAGNIAYLFGGCYYTEEGERAMNNNIYRSEDGVEWTLVEGINSDYAGSYRPSVVVNDNNVAYVFGGFEDFKEQFSSYSFTQDNMKPMFSAWAFQLQ